MHIQTFHFFPTDLCLSPQKEGPDCQEQCKFRNGASRKCRSRSLEATKAVKIPSWNRERNNREKHERDKNKCAIISMTILIFDSS